jgi:hypothetical protein
MPREWQTLLDRSNISKEEMTKNPQAVLDILGFYTENLRQEQEPEPSMKMSGMTKSLPTLNEVEPSPPPPPTYTPAKRTSSIGRIDVTAASANPAIVNVQ